MPGLACRRFTVARGPVVSARYVSYPVRYHREKLKDTCRFLITGINDGFLDMVIDEAILDAHS